MCQQVTRDACTNLVVRIAILADVMEQGSGVDYEWIDGCVELIGQMEGNCGSAASVVVDVPRLVDGDLPPNHVLFSDAGGLFEIHVLTH